MFDCFFLIILLKGSKVALSPLQMPFTLLLASIFPHQHVCLWHPLSVLCVEATAVKRHFLGPHVLQPVTNSWRMTPRRWGLLWVEKLRFATLRPHEARHSAKAVAPASSGRWFFNMFAAAKKTRRMSCKAAWLGSNMIYPTPWRGHKRVTQFQSKSSLSSKRPPAKPPTPAYPATGFAVTALVRAPMAFARTSAIKSATITITIAITIASTMAAFIGSDNGIAVSAWE